MVVVVVMGPSGSGKTTVGRALAAARGCDFIDADDLHPAANVDNMRRGEPLTEAERAPWLERVATEIQARVDRAVDAVVACSALRERYRRQLGIDGRAVRLVELRAPTEVLAARLTRRTGHFFSPSLLASQLETLEEPRDAIVVDAARPVDEIVARLQAALAG